jgi:hypothetical protein
MGLYYNDSGGGCKDEGIGGTFADLTNRLPPLIVVTLMKILINRRQQNQGHSKNRV